MKAIALPHQDPVVLDLGDDAVKGRARRTVFSSFSRDFLVILEGRAGRLPG